MTTYSDALALLLEGAKPLPTETCLLTAATGRIVAAPVRAPIALPPFDNAAMDGYALPAIVGNVAAGSTHVIAGLRSAGEALQIADGRACAIMTGACLPDGLDRVVAIERVDVLARGSDGEATRIRLHQDVPPAHNLRFAGSDIRAGSEVLPAGHRLDPAAIMLLAALGIDRVQLCRAPRAAVICTGQELVDAPGQPLPAGHIHNSNGPYCTAALAEAGVQVILCRTVADTAEAYLGAVDAAVAADVDFIVSTGAVSMGRHDFVPAALHTRSARILFRKVDIRPGKPLLCAQLKEGPVLFGLPGNPMAVAVGLRFFVAALLRVWSGLAPEPFAYARLESAQRRKPGLRHFLKARVRVNNEGTLQLQVLEGQEAYRILPLSQANAWVVIEESSTECVMGAPVRVCGLGLLPSASWPVAL